MVLKKFAGYVSRPEPADLLAGGKAVRTDQLAPLFLSDQTSQRRRSWRGIDYQHLPFDLLPRLTRVRITLMGLGGLHMFQGNFRLNHAVPPFDDPQIRRVLWHLVDQPAVMQAIGVPERFAVQRCGSFWICDSAHKSHAGAETLDFSIEKARAAPARTCYAGQPVVTLEVQSSISQTASMLLAQNLRAAGFTVEPQLIDWGTVLARRDRNEGEV